MRILRLILWAVFSILVIALAILNRHSVDVILLPDFAARSPLFLIFFAGIFTGLVTAALVTGWLRLKGFTARRQSERDRQAMGIELDRVKDELAEMRRRHQGDDMGEARDNGKAVAPHADY